MVVEPQPNNPNTISGNNLLNLITVRYSLKQHNDCLQLRRADGIRAEGKRLLEKNAIAPSAARLCSTARGQELLTFPEYTFPENLPSRNTPTCRGMQDMSVPASIATVFDRASLKDISRLSISGLSDITWHLSGAPFCLSRFSIDCSDCLFEGMGLAKRGSKSWQWLRSLRSFFLPRWDSSKDKYLARFSGTTKARANCSS